MFSTVRSAPVPVTVEELLTSQPLREAIFRDTAESHMPVAMGALRFLGECAAHTPCLPLPRPLWPSFKAIWLGEWDTECSRNRVLKGLQCHICYLCWLCCLEECNVVAQHASSALRQRCNARCGEGEHSGLGAGDLVAVERSAVADSTAVARFQAAVIDQSAWTDVLRHLAWEGSHGQAALVGRIYTSLLAGQAFADFVHPFRGCELVQGGLCHQLKPPYDTTKKVR